MAFSVLECPFPDYSVGLLLADDILGPASVLLLPSMPVTALRILTNQGSIL